MTTRAHRRILVTNDDGIRAPGLLALATALREVGEVYVVAPEQPRSATGHAVTLHKPLRMEPCPLTEGVRAWSSNGLPTDCVSLALDVAMEGRADLAVVGINEGANLGWDLTYSGTVMAAMEAAVLGLPALAVSLVTSDGVASDFGYTAQLAAQIAPRLAAGEMDRHTLLNVNVPALPADRIRGMRVARQGRREYTERIVRRRDPRGRPYYWLSGVLKDDETETDTDVAAVRDGYVSVTPLGFDMTATGQMDRLRTWWP